MYCFDLSQMFLEIKMFGGAKLLMEMQHWEQGWEDGTLRLILSSSDMSPEYSFKGICHLNIIPSKELVYCNHVTQLGDMFPPFIWCPSMRGWDIALCYMKLTWS